MAESDSTALASDELRTTEIPAAEIEIRDEAKRELGIFIVPWDTIVETPYGPETFERGAFDDTDPATVRLRMDHTDPATGKGKELRQLDDGAHMVFGVARTSRGDDQLALYHEGVETGASVGFAEVPGGTTVEYRNGRRVRVHRRVELREVSTTWRPAYERAAVMYARSQNEEVASVTDASAVAEAAETEETPVQETPAAPVQAPAPQPELQTRSFDEAVGRLSTAIDGATEKLGDRIAALEERARMQFTVQPDQPKKPEVHKGHWLQYALSAMSGDRISLQDTQYRALADIVTSDNLGVVPDAFSQELIGVIDPSRPFLSTTRRLPTPSSGMTLHVPKIVTRPTVGIQSSEKDELTSTPTSITSESFNAVTKGGAGDLSLQVLKRSDPSFLDLYLRLLAEAYAMDSEAEAIEALLSDGDVNDGLTMDPAETSLGDAFITAFNATRRGPDTIWLSTAAVGAFIDAVNPVTGQPMYSSITADFSVPGGISGTIKGLRPVHVPELGGQGADVIIGPSSGFAWAEDGTYTLQVDVPAKAGRDVAIVGILWFAPYYPSAFSVYDLAS